jgi:hypothetical protein
LKQTTKFSAYKLHILNNTLEYGSTYETTELLKTCNTGTQMKGWESPFIFGHQQHNTMIEELFTLWLMSQDDTQNTPRNSMAIPSSVPIIPAHRKLHK